LSAVSLEKAKSLSSNAAVTTARFHSVQNGGRKLDDDYEVDKKVLGQGLCGEVVLAHSKVDKRRYALKRIRKHKVSTSKLKQLTAEVEIYLSLDHPNIARLHDVYETEADICLLTECCDGGELYYRLEKKGVYCDADAADATRQMLHAIGFLHCHKVVHRDLKLENFLYQRDDSAELKLIDFGFAKIWDPSTLMMASCGSIAYVSPDVLAGKGYTQKCDLWSLGVIVWMLLAGYPPFHGEEKQMMAKIKLGQADWSHKSRWKAVSDDAVDFLKCLLLKDPMERPDALASLRHPWLAKREANDAPAVLSRDALRSLNKYGSSSRVRRAVLQLLVQELGPEKTQELRKTFLAIDKSKEGTIRLADLKEAIRNSGGKTPERLRRNRGLEEGGGATPVSPWRAKMFGAGNASGGTSPTTPAKALRRAPSDELDELFDVLDANSDEQVYYSEFLSATMEVRSLLQDEAVRATFSRLDADGSGSIGVHDFKSVLGETFEGVSMEQLVAEVDSSGKGEIDFEAFVRVLDDRPPPNPPPRSAFAPSATTPSSRGLLKSGAPREKMEVSFFPNVVVEAYGGC